MDAKRARTKSATWRMGKTPGGVEYFFARRPVHKARDFREKPVKAVTPGAKARLAKSKSPPTVPSRPVREKAAKSKAKAG